MLDVFKKIYPDLTILKQNFVVATFGPNKKKNKKNCCKNVYLG
jgi:hypothetical protein